MDPMQDADARRLVISDLLRFARASLREDGTAAWLDAHGVPEPAAGRHTWITARMAHVFAIASTRGFPAADNVAPSFVRGLLGPLRDERNGGWYAALDLDGRPTQGALKDCYAHVFVLLAAASATGAGVPKADELLDRAAEVVLTRFWDDARGRCVDAFDRTFGALDPYRGLNANMHAVEAFLAVADVTGDEAWAQRARRIADLVVGLAAEHDDRLPEHFDAEWRPVLDFNRSEPDHPFKPFGSTVGHGFEWARLLAQLAADPLCPRPRAAAYRATARALFDRAHQDGWSRDGADGFVYTVDWDGIPVVRDRMHWVVAEAVLAADVLARTGLLAHPSPAATWWRYIDEVVVDREHGSWFHQLDPRNAPRAGTWSGKPDVYHAFQALLQRDLPVGRSLVGVATPSLNSRSCAT